MPGIWGDLTPEEMVAPANGAWDPGSRGGRVPRAGDRAVVSPGQADLSSNLGYRTLRMGWWLCPPSLARTQWAGGL